MLEKDPEDYHKVYILVLEELVQVDHIMEKLAEQRSKLKESMADLRRTYQAKFGKDIRNVLDA